MRRLGPLSYVFVIALLLLYVPQELAAQSRHILIPANPDNGGPSTGAPQPQRARPPQPKPAGPEVFYCVTPDISCRTTQEVFSLAELRDLYVFVVWPGVAGQHVQTVQFLLPDGSLYASKKTQFIIGGVMAFSAAGPAFQNEVSPTPPA